MALNSFSDPVPASRKWRNLGATAVKAVAALAEHCYAALERPLIVGIGGAGGTGKTTFAANLAELLPGSCLLSTDHYKTPRSERAESGILGSSPDGNDLEPLSLDLRTLAAGEGIEAPVYDDRAGLAVERAPLRPERFVIVEGEALCFSAVRSVPDLFVYLSSDTAWQMENRLQRDESVRGYTREKAIHSFCRSNLVDFPRYGASAWEDADVVVVWNGDDYEIESIKASLSSAAGAEAQTAKPSLAGLIVPLSTPFCRDGRIDFPAMERHVKWLAKHGVTQILVCGTTGEFFSLHPDERMAAVRSVRHNFDGTVLAQVGAESLAMTREQADRATRLGADWLVALPPYYYRNVHPEGVIRYFDTLKSGLDLPLMVYNFPKHTGVDLDGEQLSAIAPDALKDSSANLELISAVSNYFVGGDSRIEECYGRGGAGFVSAAANVWPEDYVALADRHGAGLAPVLKRSRPLGGPDEIRNVKNAVAERLPGYPRSVRIPL